MMDSRCITARRPAIFSNPRVRSHIFAKQPTERGAGVRGDAKKAFWQNPPAGAAPPEQPALPWTLMGRMISEDHFPLLPEQRQQLVSSAAARAAGLSENALEARIQEVRMLLPDLGDRLFTLRSDLLVALCTDTASLALKLVRLRELLPGVNVSQVITKRPQLLLDKEFEQVPAAIAKLHTMFPEGGVEAMVVAQPLLLVEDVDVLVGEIESMLPGMDARLLLIRNPGLVLTLQRGADSLGPGAEFQQDIRSGDPELE